MSSSVLSLQIVAIGNDGERIGIETQKFLEKPSTECNQLTEMILIATVVVICILILLAISAIVFYYKKFPIHHLQRARSRVYSKLYSRYALQRDIFRYMIKFFCKKSKSKQKKISIISNILGIDTFVRI